MTDVNDFHCTAKLASFILPVETYRFDSGIDGETSTWAGSASHELERLILRCPQRQPFALEFAEAMEDRDREVSLLALELVILALLPISNIGSEEARLFRQLSTSVPGYPIELPDELCVGVEILGCRTKRPEDNLGSRLLWLTRYVQGWGKCPEYENIVALGYDETLGHEDLHERCPVVDVVKWAA